MTFKLEIGQLWDVGGCTGAVDRLTETTFEVSGVYTYPSGDNSPGLRESWTMAFLRADLPSPPKVVYRLAGSNPIYDGTQLEPVRRVE